MAWSHRHLDGLVRQVRRLDVGAALTPLTLPGPGDWGDWLARRACDALEGARAAAAALRSADPAQSTATVARWNDVQVHLDDVLSVTSLLANVHPDPAVRDQAEQAEREAQQLATELSLDRDLFEVLSAVAPEGLGEDGARMLTHTLRDFRRAGVDRDDRTRELLRSLAERRVEVGQRFARNIREGGGQVRVTPDRLAGLPADFVQAHPTDVDGLVTLTTDYPDYVPVMAFAEDRALRQEMAVTFLNRAWPVNDQVLAELLELRRETAVLLGYPDWPDYDAEVKMIGSGAAIPAFVDRVAELAGPVAQRDHAIVRARLQQDHPEESRVATADKSFYLHTLRRERFGVDAAQVRRYFDFAKVRAGLLDITGRLFDVAYTEVEGAPTWHPDVTVHDVTAGGRQLGRIYLDLHPRADKYSHAAQFTLVTGVQGRQLPEGVLVCNFPTGLMEHDDVVTLFHEFGHLLHHVLGGHQRWVRFSGVATEWDFVEAPSQMLEEWAWDSTVLASFATDDQDVAIPASLVQRMREAEEFGKGLLVRTQMFYAALSYVLHRNVPEDLVGTMRALQRRYDLVEHPPDTHFHASFGHLGGYTSGYYTYAWSEVIAKDLFSAFDPDDLLASGVARRYRDRVLRPGGSQDAADLVHDFLGRPWSFDAYERWMSA